MGNQNGSNDGPSSQQHASTVKIIANQIDKFYVSTLTKEQFTKLLFKDIQSMWSTPTRKVMICESFLLQRLYLVLSRETMAKELNCIKLKQFMQSLSKNPEKAIQKSFELIDVDNDKSISDAQFLNFMDNCFISLMLCVERQIQDNNFKNCLKAWISKNKKPIFDEILKVFHRHKKSDPEKWNYTDFKLWVLSGETWTIDIEFRQVKYQVPLNLLCLLRLPNMM